MKLKFRKRFFANGVAALLLSCALFTGCQKTGNGGIVMPVEEPEATPYDLSMIEENELPVATFIPPTPAHSAGFTQKEGLINDEYFQLAKDAGINLIMGHFESDENIRDIMDLCSEYKMGYLLHTGPMDFYKLDEETKDIIGYDDYPAEEQEAVKKAFLDRVAEFSDHPAFAGVHFVDEPGVDEFAGIGAAREVFKEVYPDKMFYVNLQSQRATAECLQYGADYGVRPDMKADDPNLLVSDGRYDYHLSEFVKRSSPELICFDLYPFTEPGLEVPSHYVQNLDIVRKYAQENGLHFWNFMQVSQYAGMDNDRRVPSLNEIAWEFNTTLAYGGKGLAYFDFFCPIEYITTQYAGGWRTTIMADGTVNEEYDYVKTVMEHIHQVDEILLNSVWKGVIQTQLSYTSLDYPGVTMDSFNQLTGAVSQSNFLIGCFNYGGKTALYVLNNSTLGMNSVTLNFSGELIGTVYREGKRSQFRSDSYTVRDLPAGFAALIVLE